MDEYNELKAYFDSVSIDEILSSNMYKISMIRIQFLRYLELKKQFGQ